MTVYVWQDRHDATQYVLGLWCEKECRWQALATLRRAVVQTMLGFRVFEQLRLKLQDSDDPVPVELDCRVLSDGEAAA